MTESIVAQAFPWLLRQKITVSVLVGAGPGARQFRPSFRRRAPQGPHPSFASHVRNRDPIAYFSLIRMVTPVIPASSRMA